MATGADQEHGAAAVRLWDAASGRQVREFMVPSDDPFASYDIESLAFSPDGETLAVAGTSFGGNARIPFGTVDLIDIAGGTVETAGDARSYVIGGVSFSPDGRLVAFGSGGGWAQVIDANDHRELRRLYTDQDIAVRDVAFLPDGKAIALGLDDGSTQVREIESERELLVLEGQSGAAGELAVGHDGQVIAKGSEDGTVRIWDTSTGREVAQLVSFPGGSWIALTAEGFFNASGGAAEHLYLSNGSETVSIDQVYDALYRPDLVREALAGDPEGKVAAAAERLNLDKVVASGLPPEVIGVRSHDGTHVEGDLATMSVDIRTRSGGIGRVEWRVNGIVQGADGRGLGEFRREGADIVRRERQVFLSPGENVVSVVVYNEANLIASQPVETTVHSSWQSVSKPSLHVLAVGVNDYFDSRLQLNYAVSDARGGRRWPCRRRVEVSTRMSMSVTCWTRTSRRKGSRRRSTGLQETCGRMTRSCSSWRATAGRMMAGTTSCRATSGTQATRPLATRPSARNFCSPGLPGFRRRSPCC